MSNSGTTEQASTYELVVLDREVERTGIIYLLPKENKWRLPESPRIQKKYHLYKIRCCGLYPTFPREETCATAVGLLYVKEFTKTQDNILKNISPDPRGSRVKNERVYFCGELKK